MEQTMTTPTTPGYRDWDIYRDSTPEAQATMDAVHAAVQKFTSPHYGLMRDARDGHQEISFTWHDGAEYRASFTREGELLRLYRIQYTGRMVRDEEDGELYPDFVWRTVRAFSKDRAGRVLRDLARPAAASWTEAAGL